LFAHSEPIREIREMQLSIQAHVAQRYLPIRSDPKNRPFPLSSILTPSTNAAPVAMNPHVRRLKGRMRGIRPIESTALIRVHAA
jgi:hypothetical protein